jgi:hypothetical protein
MKPWCEKKAGLVNGGHPARALSAFKGRLGTAELACRANLIGCMAKNWLIQPLPGELSAERFGQIVRGKLDADNASLLAAGVVSQSLRCGDFAAM